MEALLEKIGLTKSEIKVYEALLELGSTSTGKIVDKAKVTSSKIYEILDRLIDKGLANYIIESGIKKFDAATPERLMEYMKEKESEIDRQKEELANIIPKLKLKQTLSKYKSSAKVYKGIKGVETAFNEALDLLKDPKTDEMLVIGIPSRTTEENRFFVKYAKKRAEKKFRMRAIINEEARGELQVLKKNLPLSEIKFNNEKTPAAINIFKDRTIIFPQTKTESTIIVIDNKEVSESFRVQFEMWWSQRTQTYEGKEAIQDLFREMINFGDYCVLAENFLITEILGKDFYIWWQKEKERKGIKSKGVMNSQYKGTNLLKNKTTTKFKYLDNYDSPGATFVFKDKVINLIYSESPVAIRIDNKEMAYNYQSYFDMIWNQNVSSVVGFDKVTSKYNQMLESLDKNEEYYVLGASLESGDAKLSDWLDGFHKQRIKQRVKVKFLTSYEAFKPIQERVTKFGDSNRKITKIKKLPPDFTTPFQINLFKKDIVWFTLWGKELSCFEIKSKEVYNNFKTYFDALWNQETTISKGFEGLKNDLIELYDDLEKHNLPYNVISAAYGPKGQNKEYSEFFKKMYFEREKRNINGNILFEQGTEVLLKKYKNFRHKDNTKYMPYNTNSPVAILPGHEKTLILVQGDNPTTITINNKEVSKSFQNNFKSLWNQETRIIKGLDSVENLFNEILEYKSADFFAARGYFFEKRKEFLKSWSKRAKEKDFKLRNIIDKKSKGHIITKLPFCKTKYNLPEEIANMSVYWIFGEKVAISNWMGDEPIVIIIENKEFHDLYKQQFEELWNKD